MNANVRRGIAYTKQSNRTHSKIQSTLSVGHISGSIGETPGYCRVLLYGDLKERGVWFE